MQKEFSAKSLEEALEIAGAEFGVEPSTLKYQKISETGFLLFKTVKILVSVPEAKEEVKEEISETATVKEEIKEVVEETVEEVKEEAVEVNVVEEKVDIVEEIVETLNEEAKPSVSVELADKIAKDFVANVLEKMGIEANVSAETDMEEETVYVNIEGPDMGVMIGKRGQTLDSLQYLTSLVVNRACTEVYLKVKLDTENYRARRKETLENLAKNISSKVRRTRRSVTLEPMNPYERRIIHSVLQNDKFVETHSEGEEPYRKVVISLKKDAPRENRRYNGGRNNKYGNRNGGYKKGGYYNNKRNYPKYNDNSEDYSQDYKADYAAYLESKAAAKAAAENGESK